MSDHRSHHDHDHDGLAEVLDLDAEVFAPAMRSVFDDIERSADSPIRSVLDLGAGTGTGTFGLLQHFTDAHAIALDASAEMLARLAQRAEHLGLADRVGTAAADLDEVLPVVGPFDLAWASASLHHLADPEHTLVRVAEVIRPGGLLAVVELDGMPLFLPDSSAGGTAERRAHELLASDRATDMPTMGSDWGPRLTQAGLVVEQHRAISLDLPSPVPVQVNRYASSVLTRIRGFVADRLGPADRQALDSLLDGGPDDVRHRSDLRVSVERRLWIARRPR